MGEAVTSRTRLSTWLREWPMKLLIRTILTLALTGVLALCLFGFFASSSDHRSARQLPWRLVCLAGIVGCVTGTLVLWSGDSDESK